MEIPRLARIDIFPIKSLDGISVDRVQVSSAGTLVADREFALVDQKGYWINGKRTSAIHHLRSTYDLENRRITLGIEGHDDRATFSLEHERDRIITWIGRYLQQPVKLRQSREGSFSDDVKASGPTSVSTATLEAVAQWYSHLSVDELRRRFRSNLEIDGVPAFWEDCLYDAPGTLKPFSLGTVPFVGCYPCQRCIVPTRDSRTGEGDRKFQKTMAAQREQTLPEWANRDQFKHFYRLAVNTKIPEPAEDLWLSVGDRLTFPTEDAKG
ncbi:MAG: MOSC N-terminal beta barrel domain-containing protein [Cyanobacteria bacterium P01_D01_bin.73]